MRASRLGSLLLLLLLGSTGIPALSAQATTVILVRHAEKTGPSGDVDLSAVGQARAEDLATTLANFPVQAIFISNTRRTQQTAAPLATRLGLTPVVVPIGRDVATQMAATAAAIRAMPAGSAALVVGHSNTVTGIIAALGGPQVNGICDPEYATLFVLELPVSGQPRLLRATYGATDPAEADACRDPRPAMEQRHQ